MVFPDDETMLVLMAISIGNVRDGESKTTLHLKDKQRSSEVEIRPQVVSALEQLAWIKINEFTMKISITKLGTKAVDAWIRNRFKVK